MKKFITLIVLFSMVLVVFAEEFKGFLGIPFGTSKAQCLAIMENKGWTFQSSMSDYKTQFFTGKKYAGKDITGILMSFEGNNLNVVCVMLENSDAVEIFKAMSKKYGLRKIENENYYITNDYNAIISLSDGALIIIDPPMDNSTLDSDI